MSSYAFNPFTSNLDIVGSGASYIDGVVATPASLPVTLNTPPLDAVFLAKAGSGVWLISRRPAGLYCRVANNGNANDWVHLGAFPEVNAAANWEVYGSDATKRLKFNVDGLPTATLRTVDAPAGNGQMLVEGQSIGATTRASGAFTTLNATNGTITASAPVLDLEQTWNNAAVAFTGMRLNCVQTANSTSSSYFTISRTGTPVFQIVAQSPNIPLIEIGAGGFITRIRGRTASGTGLNFDGAVGVGGSLQFGVGTTTGSGDVILARDSAADTLALQRVTNPQTFRLYNTFTDASNHERGFISWVSNTLRIGTEAAGTGSARNLELQTNGTTRVTIGATTGNVVCSQSLSVTANLTFQGNATIQGNIGAGILRLLDNAGTSFDRLQFGGGTNAFPALKRSSTALQVRLADDSAFAPLEAAQLTANGQITSTSFVRATAFQCGTANQGISFGDGFTFITGPSTAGVLSINAFNGTDVLVRLGGTSSSWPALNTSGSTLRIRLADNSGFAPLSCGALTLNGNLTASTRDIVTDTTTGTRIGTGTTQLLGFWNATPAAQPAAVADATDAATTQARLNDLLARLRTIGLIAT